jgi:hypothetical protein
MADNDQIKLRTSVFRAAFVNVFQARKAPGNDRESFSLVALFAKDDPWLKEAKQAAAAACRKKWGNEIPKNLKNPFKDGASKADLDGFGPEVTFLNFKTYQRPGVVDGALQAIIDPSDFYSGCYARATVTAYADNHKVGGPYVSFFLNNVQKVKDGAPFGRTRAENDFEAVPGAKPSTGGAAAPAASADDALFE